MLVSKALPLLLAAASAKAVRGGEATGYLMDNQCLNNCANKTGPCTPDQANAYYTPQVHTGWCLLLATCEQSRYSVMSAEPDANGMHTPILSLSGDAAHNAAVEYIRATTASEDLTFTTKVPFPLVTIVYDDHDYAVTDDGSPPQVVSAVIKDPWSEDGAAVYSGSGTTQTVCSSASDADIDKNNMCFRSDVKVSTADVKKMIVIESGGCPDHVNMKGGSGGVIKNDQALPGDCMSVVSDVAVNGCCGR